METTLVSVPSTQINKTKIRTKLTRKQEGDSGNRRGSAEGDAEGNGVCVKMIKCIVYACMYARNCQRTTKHLNVKKKESLYQ